jgi:flagellar basal body-associated protein FliL
MAAEEKECEKEEKPFSKAALAIFIIRLSSTALLAGLAYFVFTESAYNLALNLTPQPLGLAHLRLRFGLRRLQEHDQNPQPF